MDDSGGPSAGQIQYTRANVEFHERLRTSGFFRLNENLALLLEHLGPDALHRIWVSSMDRHMLTTDSLDPKTCFTEKEDCFSLAGLPRGKGGGYRALYRMPDGGLGVYVGTSNNLRRRNAEHESAMGHEGSRLYEMVKGATLISRVRTTRVDAGTRQAVLGAASEGGKEVFAAMTLAEFRECVRRAFEVLEIAHFQSCSGNVRY